MEGVIRLVVHQGAERREGGVGFGLGGQVVLVQRDAQLATEEAAVDEQSVPVLVRFPVRGVVGLGDTVQARLAPRECQLVLLVLAQHLDHVVEDPQVCEGGGLGVEFGSQRVLGLVGL
ncbi:hypothetical protein [Streptomyces sp. NBC_00873]|uniref:hypothetical protein n=1 Tax=Streptomyces sp. NBC_00873 TaxID=2975852 RepID=UPI003866C8E0